MKRHWACLLAFLIIVALLTVGATAESGREIVLDFGLDGVPGIEILEGEALDVPELPLDVSGLSDLPELALDVPDSAPTEQKPTGVVSNDEYYDEDEYEDFDIADGVLLDYFGPGGDVIIPDIVTAIDGSVFSGRADITSVTIPKTVKSIGKYAFADCTNLTNVTIPVGVKTIGVGAFSNCVRLTGVAIPTSVKTIGNAAFSFCSSLTAFTIPTSVTSISDSLFSGCTKLSTIAIPDSVKSIGALSFYQCASLKNVNIPTSVTSIEALAFSGCTSLKSFTIPKSVKTLAPSVFSGCTNLTQVSIPSSVTSLGKELFYNCSNLASVTIPSTVTDIGVRAFSGCSKLKSVTIPDNVKFVDDYAFSRCAKLTSVSIGRGVDRIARYTFNYCKSLKTVEISENVTSIANKAFRKCYNLKNVTLKNGKVSIHEGAFVGCPFDITFHTPCESKTTKWAEAEGYKVVKSAHVPVIDPAVAPKENQPGLTQGSHCAVCDMVLVKQEPVSSQVDISSCKISDIGDEVYTGKAIKPGLVVEYDGKTLAEGTDYTVKYADNKAVGVATVKITGKGGYSGSVKKTFVINPKAVTLSSVKAGRKKLTVKWKKGAGIDGYEIEYSQNKDFKDSKTKTIEKAGTEKTDLEKLTKKKTYYVRIRAYKTVDGKKYYSEWSKSKSAKVK